MRTFELSATYGAYTVFALSFLIRPDGDKVGSIRPPDQNEYDTPALKGDPSPQQFFLAKLSVNFSHRFEKLSIW